VYAGGHSSNRSGSVVIFGRNVDGSLVQLSGEEGCVVEQGTPDTDGCATARGITGGVMAVFMSPDGKNLYATINSQTSSLVVLGRNVDGSLVQLSGEAGCIVEQGASNPDGCATGRGLGGSIPFPSIFMSPDGKNLYHGNGFTNSLAVFSILQSADFSSKTRTN